MIQKQFFQKHHKRMVTEAIIKAALWGLLLGSCANFLAAMAAWLFDFGGILFAVAIGVGVAMVSGLIFYFVKFRPSVEVLAYRVDRLGLEERMITMLQLQEDDSVIARLQRENAQAHLQDVQDKKLRMRLPKAVIALMVVALVLSCSMTTVLALAEEGVLPPGSELIDPTDPMAELLAISYLAGEGGEIEGETDQLLLPGEDGTPVVAVPEDGWVFVGWDDGWDEPERQELAATSGAVYMAQFQEIGEGGEETGEGEGSGEGGQGEGDQAPDVPAGGESQTEGAQGGQGEDGSGSGADSSNQGGQGEGEEQGEGKGDGKGQGAGGKYDDTNNQFLDGQTYYRDYLEMYYQMALDFYEKNGEIPSELWEFFEAYFESI